jgi:type VI secretion system protein ImpK
MVEEEPSQKTNKHADLTVTGSVHEKQEDERGATDDKELVVKQFYDFFRDVSGVKQDILIKERKESIETQDYEKGVEYIQEIRRRLEGILVEAYEKAHALDWGHGRDYYKESQYLMCVFADETFINLEWFGAKEWREELLEKKFFNTSNSGDRLFELLDELLEKRTNLLVGLAKVYLLVLALGFKGRYRGDEGIAAIDSYKKRLFIFIYGGKYDYREISTPIFEEAYLYTPVRTKRKLLPVLSRTMLIFFTVIMIYVVGSCVIWYKGTSEISRMVKQVYQKQVNTIW